MKILEILFFEPGTKGQKSSFILYGDFAGKIPLAFPDVDKGTQTCNFEQKISLFAVKMAAYADFYAFYGR